MINQYTQQIKREVNSSISKIPKSDGTINGLSKRLQTFQKLLKDLDQKLKTLGNEYLDKYGETKENIEKIKSINVEEMKRFVSSMNK